MGWFGDGWDGLVMDGMVGLWMRWLGDGWDGWVMDGMVG